MPAKTQRTPSAKKNAKAAARPGRAARPRPAKARPAPPAPTRRSWFQRWQDLSKRQPEIVWLLVLTAAAAVLRWMRPDWYAAYQFHPDERWIFGVVAQLSYPEAPIALQYGTLPMYLLAAAKDIAALIASWFGPFDANRFVIWAGRMLSGAFDIASVPLLYGIGIRLTPGPAGRRLGLLAAGFLTFSVLNIQLAHFFTTDVPLTTLSLATLYASLGILSRGQRRDYLTTGVLLGLTLATKTSGAPLILAIGAAHLLSLRRAPAGERGARWQDLLLAAAASLAAFFVAMPHAFLDWGKFWSNQNEQRRILVTGEADVPYNRQYLRTVPFVYYFRNLARYLFGWPLGILSVGAFLFYPLAGGLLAWRRIWSKRWEELNQWLDQEAGWVVVLGFGLAYLIVIGGSFAKFNRYLLPLVPVLLLAGSRLLLAGWEAAKTVWLRRAAAWAIGALLAVSALWALAFVSIYQHEHPWVAATRWMHEHLPETVTDNGALRPTSILNEEWGDDLPVGVVGLPGKNYQIRKFPVQEPDTPRKREIILNMLQNNDVIVMADTRAHAVYRRLADRYPINAAYYEGMFAEDLGFRLAADFSNYPRLFGMVFRDDEADESFTLYDHPHVYLFTRESPPLPEPELARRLDERIAAKAAAPARPAPAKDARVQGHPAAPAEPLPAVINRNIDQTQAKPWFPFIRVNSFSAGLAWLLLIEVIGLLALPLCWRLYPGLPDLGASLSKIVGTLVFTWIVWVLVNLGLVRHTQGASFVILLALAGLSAWAAAKTPGGWQALLAPRRRAILIGEAVFVLSFVLYMLTKLYNPDIHNPFGQGYNGGGEPMGMTFFTSVIKSVHFPPQDPWLSGYHINYYYYGHVILGILAKLIGVPSAWSYNIVISLLFALTCTGLFGLGLALTNKVRWGLAAAVAGAMLGNVSTFFYLLDPLNRGINWAEGWPAVARWLEETWRHAGRFEFLWNPTRLIKGTINEMPWFSFLYGDLHAHIIAIPYSLPLIGWALHVLQQPKPADPFIEAPGQNRLTRVLVFGVAALTLGSLSAINTWNFPPYALLVLGTLVIRARLSAEPKAPVWAGLGQAGLAWLRVLLTGLLLMFFFHRYFVPQSTTVAWVNPAVRTHLREFLLFFGLTVFGLMSLWAVELVPVIRAFFRGLVRTKRQKAPLTAAELASLPRRWWERSPATLYTAIALAVGLGLAAWFEQANLGVVVLLTALAGYVLAWRPMPVNLRLAMLLATLGLAIVVGCEVVHIRDFMGVGGDMSRMNTVFKFYMVVWIYFALALAAAGATLAERLQPKRIAAHPNRSDRWRLAGWTALLLVLWAAANYFQVNEETPWLTWLLAAGILLLPWVRAGWPGRPEVQWAWAAMLAALVFATALYPPVSLYNRMRLCSGFAHPTLSGTAYLDRMNPQDAKALAWINANLDRTEIVLEAPGVQGYNCFDTRSAIFTGMPTLIGWVGEEEQMRYNEALTGSRKRDADMIFGTVDARTALDLMERYRVRYVYVGANERKAYPAVALAKFASFMDVAYDQNEVVIYRRR